MCRGRTAELRAGGVRAEQPPKSDGSGSFLQPPGASHQERPNLTEQHKDVL